MGPRDDELTSLDASGDVGDDGSEPAENVEQYVRLHEHVERLRADVRPPQPGALEPDEAAAYPMAALFRAASPGADTPDPRFVAALLERMERAAQGQPSVDEPASASESPARAVPPQAPRRGVSRRSLLNVGLGAAAAAAGLAAGIGIEKAQRPDGTPPTPPDVPLVREASGTWVAVATTSALPLGSVLRFSTPTIVGYVRHTSAGFSALSGVCTHMGCLLQWNNAARTFDCPCHGGRFTEDGASAPGSAVIYKPLPPLKTKIEGGSVWVLVASAPAPSDSSATPTASGKGTYGTGG